MKASIAPVVALLATVAGIAAAQPAGTPLNAEAASSFSDFQNYGPHRAFVVGPDGKANWWAGAGGPDPGGAVASALKRCEERTKERCALHVVNNYTVTNQDWRELVPA